MRDPFILRSVISSPFRWCNRVRDFNTRPVYRSLSTLIFVLYNKGLFVSNRMPRYRVDIKKIVAQCCDSRVGGLARVTLFGMSG